MNDDFRAQVHVVEDELARLSSRIEAFKAAFHEHPTRVEWNGTQWMCWGCPDGLLGLPEAHRSHPPSLPRPHRRTRL